MGVRQRMFSPVSGLQRSGSCWPSATPEASGPRNDGHAPTDAAGRGSVPRAGPAVRTILRAGADPRCPAAVGSAGCVAHTAVTDATPMTNITRQADMVLRIGRIGEGWGG